jgi:hypothetical protein
MLEIHPRKVKIRRKIWTLTTHPLKGCDGLCEPYPDSVKKHIWIKPSLTDVDALDTIIHECLHCAFPDIDEDAITESATSIAKILWDLGYRGEWDD